MIPPDDHFAASRSPALSDSDAGPSARLGKPDRLTPADWLACTQISTRLHAELTRLIRSLPAPARTASGMSRHIGVLRVTCQRLTKALRESTPTPMMLAELPGVEGLQQFVRGCARAGATKDVAESAETAVEAYAKLVRQIAGSRTRLIERLTLGEPGVRDRHPDLGGLGERRSLYESAAVITGRSCRVALAIYAFRPAPNDGAILQRAMAKGLFGARVRPGGMPLVLSAGDTMYSDDPAHALALAKGVPPGGRTPEALLRRFTSDPLPTITTRARSGMIRQVVDATSTGGRAIDVVTTMMASSPMFQEPGVPSLESVWSLVSCPSENLLLDVYLHRSIERHYRPALDAQLWNTDLTIPTDERWVTRLPAQPRLEIITPDACESDIYPRTPELTATFLGTMNWDPSEFVGFRCEVEYPIWRAGYSMSFEHVGPAAV